VAYWHKPSISSLLRYYASSIVKAFDPYTRPILFRRGRRPDPTGSLAVLKDTWTSTLESREGVVEYLRELRERFKSADQYASSHADEKQTQYATRYNLCSQDKVFNVGDTSSSLGQLQHVNNIGACVAVNSV